LIASVTRRSFLIGAGATLACLATQGPRAFAQQRDVSWLSEVQRPPDVSIQNDATALDPLLVADDGNPISTLDQWLAHRVKLRQRWLTFLGDVPERPAVNLEVLREDSFTGGRRLLVRYECEPGLSTEGYLLYPDPIGTIPRAGLVALHQTTPDTIDEIAGVSGPEMQALGPKLVREGFVVFCPRCFLWEDPSLDYVEAVRRFQERRPGALGMRKMLNDAQSAVDVLSSLPEVDAQRIGAVGHSLGAKETLYLAAFDDRIQAAVASEGGIGLTFSNWHDPWYLGPAIREPGFSLNHHQLLALIAPRPFLILGGESGGPAGSTTVDGDRTWPFIDAALPVYRLYGEPARIGLYNHRQGHTIPVEAYDRMADWLRTYLGETR
jgi:hypothetical protein